MKIKKLKAELSGVISIASYENLRPLFGMEVDLEDGEDPSLIYEKMRSILREQFKREGISLYGINFSKNKDKALSSISIESGDSIKVLKKKILRFSNDPEKSDYFINECKVLNYQQATEEFVWEIRTKKRENVYYYIIN
jgi:hypothetical protein